MIKYFILFVSCNLFLFNNKILGNEIMHVEYSFRNNYFILNLPYEVENDIEIIFAEDTPLATEIMEIWADGVKLSFINDTNVPLGRTYYDIRRKEINKNRYFISMYWRIHQNGILRWNDGRGIIFNEIAPGMFSHMTNTYEINQYIENLVILYRIVIPYPTLSINNLYDIKYNNKIYSKNYRIEANLFSIFGNNK